jgi:hypothetical protein
MLDHVTEQFPHGDGLDDDVLTEFGVSRQVFVLLTSPNPVLPPAPNPSRAYR